MYILKNAFLNIRSAKGRNILIGLIVLVVAVSSCIALSVKQAAKRAQAEGLKNLSVTASISFDRSKLMQNAKTDGANMREQMQNVKDLTLDEMKSYAQSAYVKGFLYFVTTTLNGKDAQPVSDEDDSEETTSAANASSSAKSTPASSTQGMTGNMPEGMGGRGRFAQGDFSVVGYSSYKAMSSFVSGSSRITAGEMFDVGSDANVCVISEELAAFNNLQVGSRLTLANPGNEEQFFAFTVVGIYANESTNDSDSFGRNFSTAMDSANRIYTSYATLSKFITYTADNAVTSTDDNGREQTTALRGTTSGTYTFAGVEEYEAFCEDVRARGLSESYTVSSADVRNYENSLVPIQNTAKFAGLMLWVVLGVGGAILIVLNIFNIRERKYEVGVLTAIGMKKRKVALQFVAELMAVTLVAIIVGTTIGAALSVPVSDALLSSQLAQQKEQEASESSAFGQPGSRSESQQGAQSVSGGGRGNMSMGNLPGMLGGGATTATEYVTVLNASTDFTVVLQLVGIGVLLTLLSSLVAVVFVMRYEPLKILSERS